VIDHRRGRLDEQSVADDARDTEPVSGRVVVENERIRRPGIEVDAVRAASPDDVVPELRGLAAANEDPLGAGERDRVLGQQDALAPLDQDPESRTPRAGAEERRSTGCDCS
jgi:hypothetical protein